MKNLKVKLLTFILSATVICSVIPFSPITVKAADPIYPISGDNYQGQPATEWLIGDEININPQVYDWGNYFDTEKIINENGPIDFKKFYVNGSMSIINTEYDVAKMKWGDPWKMPTKKQLEELIRECEVYRVKLKGQDKYNFALFKGPNGKSIIFPLAGEKYKTELRTSWGEICWSGELRPYYSASSQNSLFAFYMGFNNPGVRIYSEGFRCNGLNVRAVR